MNLARVPAGKKRCARRDVPDVGPLLERTERACCEPGEWVYEGSAEPRLCFAHMLDRLAVEVAHRRRTAILDGEFTFLRPALCGGIVSCHGLACRPGCDDGCKALGKAGDEMRRMRAAVQEPVA